MGTNIFDELSRHRKKAGAEKQQTNIFDQLSDQRQKMGAVNSLAQQVNQTLPTEEFKPLQAAGHTLRHMNKSIASTGQSALRSLDFVGRGEKLAESTAKLITGKEHDYSIPNPFKAADEKIERFKEKYYPEDDGYVRAKGAKGFAEDVVGGFTQMGPQVAMAVMSGGSTLAPAIFGGMQIHGMQYDDLAKEVGHERAQTAALANAFAGGALERVGLKGIFKGWKPSQKAADYLKNFGTGFVNESMTEFAQKYPEYVADIWARSQGKTDQEVAEKFFQGLGKATKEAVYEGLIGGIVGGSVSVGGGAVADTNKQVIADPKSERRSKENLAANQALLELRKQNPSTDELRKIRDTPELQALHEVDSAAVEGLLNERAVDLAQAEHIIENEPNPGPLTRAGKIGVRQEMAKHIQDTVVPLDKNASTPTQAGMEAANQAAMDLVQTPDTDAAQQLAEVLGETDIQSEEDRTERAGYARQFLDDPKVSDKAKQHFIDSGVPEKLGVALPGSDQQGPKQEEWDAQTKKSQIYNQVKNKKPAELSPEEIVFMEEYDKGNESVTEYPGGPLVAAKGFTEKEIADHERKVRQEKESWQEKNRRQGFNKRLAELHEEAGGQDNIDTGVLALADPAVKKQAEKEAEAIVRENPVHAHKLDIRKRGGLDIHQAKQTWDEQVVNGLIRNSPGLFAAKVVNGQTPLEIDTTADELGYESADAMMQAFVDAPTIKSETSRLIQEYEKEWTAADAAQAADESLQQTPIMPIPPVTEQSPEDFKILLDRVMADPAKFSEEDFAGSSVSGEQRKTLVAALHSKPDQETTPDVSIQDPRQTLTAVPARNPSYPIESGEKSFIVEGDPREDTATKTGKRGATVITGEDGRAYILEDLAASVYKAGQSLAEFTEKLKEKLGNAFEQIKDQVRVLYDGLNAHLETFTTGAEVGALVFYKDLNKAQRKEVKKNLDSHPDGKRIAKNLEAHRGTSWDKAAVDTVLVRQGIEDLLAGKSPKVESSINAPSTKTTRDIILEKGEQGIWDILNSRKFIGTAEKPGFIVSASYSHCDPSKECAKFCYATRGRNYAANQVKNELISWAVEKDPVRAANRTAAQYKATTEFEAGKALRLFERGDMTESWVPFIKQMNKRGVRVHVFSKRPELLRQISEKNVRMLSIDNSNFEMADKNPNLSIALVYRGKQDLQFAKDHAEQIGVVLPINEGRRHLHKKELAGLPAKVRRRLCPVDAGVKTLKDGWKCTKCDVLGGIGCYKGVSTNSLRGIEEPLYNRDIEYRINKIRIIAEGLPDGSRQDLYAELDLLLSQVRRGIDPGEAGQSFTEVQAGNRIPDWRRNDKDPTYKSSAGYSTVESGGNSYEVPNNRTPVVYGYSKSAAGVSEPVPAQTTIFGREEGSRPGSTRARKKFLEAHPAKIGTFKFDLDKIESVEDAAQVLSPIGMKAQETFMALVLDASKQPISVIQHSVGGPRSNQIFIPEFLGSIHNLKGAESVWIAHNHPSSSLKESPQDAHLTIKLENAIRNTGVDLLGHLIITPGGKAAAIDVDGEKKRSDFSIVQPSRKDRSVKVTERRLKGDSPELLSETPVQNSTGAKDVMAEHAKGQNGILLLNSQHQPIVFMPASLGDMQNLRDGKGRLAAKLYRTLDKKNNAVAAMLNFSGDSNGHKVAEENMAKFTNAIGVDLLDSFMKGRSRSDTGTLQGIKSSAGDTFYSISTETLPKKEQSPIKEELESSLGKSGLRRLIKSGLLEIISPELAKQIPGVAGAQLESKYSKEGRVEGFTMQDGKVYLVDGNIRKSEAMAVLSHELGVHAMNLGFKDARQFKSILKMLEKRSKAKTAEGHAIREAMARIPKNTKPEHRQEEILAYLISSSPEIGVVRRFIAAVKKFLVEKVGLSENILRNIDLHALSLSIVKREVANSDVKNSFTTAVEQSAQDARMSVSKEDNQAIRGTENLNVEKDGVTSTSSLSHGEKIVAEIIRKLRVTSSPALAVNRYGTKVVAEAVEAYRKAGEVIDNPHKSIAEKQKFAASFANKLPAAPRSKLLQRLSAISRVKEEETKQKRLKSFLELANNVLTDHLRRDLLSSLEKYSARFKLNKDKIARGRGYELERDLAYMRNTAFKLESPDAILAEEARLDALGTSLGKRLLSAKTTISRERIQDKIDDVQSRANLLQIFGMIETQSFDGLVNARAVLQQILADGRAEWRAVQDTWRRRHQINRKKAAEEITGSEEPELETTAEEQKRIEKEKSLLGQARETASAIMNSIQSWELSMDRIAGKSGNKTLNSWLVRHFGSIAHKATRDYERMQMDTNDMLMKKAAEIFGVKSGRELAKVFAKLNKVESNAVFFRGKQPATMSPLQAAYWYQISLDKNNETMLATFEEMGVTDKTLREIEGLMGRDLKRWADYLVDEFYQDFHDDTNDIYRQIYGIDLAKNKNYVPWKRKKKGKIADKGHEGFLAGMMAGTIKKGALRERVENSIPFMTANLNDVLMQHVSDMNHFKAWAIPTKEINGTFNDAEVQGYIRQHYGASTLKEIRRFQDHFVRSESELRDDMQWLDKWRGKITTAMIGANPTVFLKQLASIPAYAADIPPTQWVKYTGQAMANPVKAAMILGESTMMKARYKKGFERDVANAMRKGGNDMVAQSKRISDKLMILTSLGDRIAITMGGYAVYKYHLVQNKKDGMSEKAAHQKALTSFEMATERSQQSGNVKDIGGFQRGTPLMKLFTMYMTAPASYSRQIFTAVRQAKENPVDSAKRLFIYGVVLPSLFQAVSDAFMITPFGGNDDDDEKFWKNQVKALILAPFNGLPVIRTMMEGYANAVSGKSFYDDQYTPMMQTLTTSKDMVSNTVKWAKGGTERIDPSEYLMRAMWDATQLGGYATGIPVRPIAKVATGIKDAVVGETEFPVRRSLGYSPSIVGE